jgi:hypothetical protein
MTGGEHRFWFTDRRVGGSVDFERLPRWTPQFWRLVETDEPQDTLGLSDAIALLRADLLEAQAEGARQRIHFPVQSMTVQLQVLATRSRDGKAGFRVPLVGLEVGAGLSWQRDTTQTVTVVFGPPVDDNGVPVNVADATDQLKK